MTCEEDAHAACASGAAFVGIIFADVSRRCVRDMSQARAIADAAKRGGAEPVGVFLEQDASEIVRICEEAGIGIAQLHGDPARAALKDLPHKLRAIWVLNVSESGEVKTPLPKELFDSSRTTGGGAGTTPMASRSVLTSAFDWQAGARRTIDYVLMDGMQPGSGEAYDWTKLTVPRGCYRKGWVLAGGLHPGNVAEAIRLAKPDVLDVASGVAGEDGVRKDTEKIRQFFDAVNNAYNVPS